MRLVQGLALIGLVGGCHAARSAGTTPLAEPATVRLHFVGQDCADHPGGDGDPVARDLDVRVRVDNPTDAPLHIAEESIRLFVDGLYRTGLRAPTLVTVAPRSSAVVTLAFRHHALCEPDRVFAIEWNDALVLDDAIVRADNPTFHP